MKKKSWALKVLLIALLISVGLPFGTVQAQKRKKKKQKLSQIQEVAKVSQEDKRKAEMFHAEAEKYFILEDFAKAFVLYQRSLELDPQNATAYYKIGLIYLKGKETEKAIFNLRKAISMDPVNKYFYLQLADVYTKQSKFSDAAEVYETMLQKCKKVDEYMFELAAMYIYQEKYDQALLVYDKIEDRFGLNEQVIAQKQKLYIKLSKLDMAIKEGQKLIDAFPGDPKYMLNLADILISNNKSDEAVPYLEEIVADYPDNARALLLLADYYRKQNNNEKSNIYLNRAFGIKGLNIQPKIQVLATIIQKLPNKEFDDLALSLGEKIIVAHPDDPRAFEINGDLNMKLSKDSAALADYKTSLTLGSDNYNTWQNVLQLELSMEKYKQAVEDGEQALELFPNQAGLCWFLGNAYFMEKDYNSAAEIFETGKKLSGSNEELKSYFNAQLGDTYNTLKEYKKSDDAYDATLSYNPENDHVLNNYSYFLALRKEKLDLAKKMCLKLLQLQPDNPTYLDTYAWVLFVKGEYNEAKKYIEKAVQGEQTSGTIIEHYGDILFKLGDIDGAVMQWQKAKGMDETSELIDKKIADRNLYE